MEWTLLSEAPEICHRWTAVATIAGALKRNVWYEAGGFEWTPNFYVVLTGPPGVIQKSTTAANGTRLLEHVPGVHFGPDSATWHGLLPKFKLAEATVETSHGMRKVSPLTMSVSELGSFLKLSQEGLDAVLIDMWDGTLRSRPWVHTTQTHGDKEVWNGLLNLFGCTTLGWLRENVPASALETGLISRIIFVYGEEKRERIAIPKLDPRWNPQRQRERKDSLVRHLQEIALLRGPFDLTPPAAAWMQEWYHKLDFERVDHMASERFAVYKSRKQTHLMKLAMAIAAGRGQHPSIPEDTLEAALEMLTVVEQGIVRIFDTIGGSRESAHLREVLSTVRRSGGAPVTFAALLRTLGGAMTHDELGLAVRHGIASGALLSVDSGERTAGGNPILGIALGTQSRNTATEEPDNGTETET